MHRTFALAGSLVLAAIVIQGYRIVSSSGLLVHVEPRPLSCTAIEGLTGAEDITIDARSGYAYISTDDRRATRAGRPVAGAIHGIDLAEDTPVPRLLWQGTAEGFHPHGICLLVGDEGTAELLAINHGISGDNSVERFSVPSPGELRHLESITFPELISPNDLVAVGERRFYVTNDHGSLPGWRQSLEDYLGLPFANVAYFDGEHATIAADGFRYPNGITVSADGQLLVVAETTGRRLQTFARDPATGALAPRSTIALDTGADNLEWGPGGELLVAGHPRLFDFMAHSADPAALSPSQILSVALKDGPDVEELYANDGSELSGASVAAAINGRMLIGSVFEDRILLCDL